VNQLTAREQLELDIEDQLDSSYGVRMAVVGLSDVVAGYRPSYPVTVYQLSGDDTSGIAGLLFPSGEFRPVTGPKKMTDYWEPDETLAYEPHYYENETPPRWGAKANSWTKGEVLWDGTAGHIDNNVEMETEVFVTIQQQKSGTVFVKGLKAKVTPHVRSEDINSVTGEWATHGENDLRDVRQPGVIHLAHLAEGRWSAMGDKAA